MGSLGSESNPLRLVPDINERILFSKATGIGTDDEGIVTVMSKMKEPRYETDLYVKNLISNPMLKKKELKLGLLIFRIIDMSWGATFLTVKKTDYRMSGIGENGILHVSDKRTLPSGYDILEKQSLLEIANKYNLKIDTETLIRALNRLHSFFYITCTEISHVNAASERVGFNYDMNEVLLSDETKLIHIRLNERFTRFDLSKKWKRR
ncbi:hypothetical protein EYS14_24740 [Alteromonadaceae bacterium M269]|nr:hypothetical protein EYS14_24740 [Alteromonadaceae bacterium M269]